LKLEPIGAVRKRSETEDAIELAPGLEEGLHGVCPGDALDVLYWMHNLSPSQREATKVHPRGDRSRPLKGVFGLRSPMRPNPIGVTTVRVKRLESNTIVVTSFDAQEGSPVIDLKAVRKDAGLRRLTETWGRMHDTIVRTLEEAFGEERLRETLKGPMRELGGKAAESSEPDARAIGREIMRFEEGWDLRGEVLEDAPDRFARKITHCPWSHLSPLGCRVFAWWMEGFCQGMNASFSYRLEKLTPAGDKYCLWSVTRKRSG